MFSGRLVYLKLPFVNKMRWIEKFVYRFLQKYVYQFFGEPFRSFPGVLSSNCVASNKLFILLMCPDASSEDFRANVAGWELLGRAPCPPCAGEVYAAWKGASCPLCVCLKPAEARISCAAGRSQLTIVRSPRRRQSHNKVILTFIFLREGGFRVGP